MKLVKNKITAADGTEVGDASEVKDIYIGEFFPDDENISIDHYGMIANSGDKEHHFICQYPQK